MSDIRLDKIIQWGTEAERLAFTPSPPAGIQTLYIWHESDTGQVYHYVSGAWAAVTGAVVGPPAAAQTSFLVSGGQVVWEEDYIFRVSAAVYYIAGVRYESLEQTVTLDAADATLDRIDVVAVDTTGTVVKVTGTAAAQPSEPDVDPGTQLRLSIVLVTAATTAPPAATPTVLYAENAGDPGEWDWTSSGAGWTLASIADPRTGTTHIEATAIASGAYVQGQIGSGTFDPNGADFLVLQLKPKASWPNNRTLQVTLRSAGVVVGSPVTIANGVFGFESSVLAYQQVAIPVTAFAVPAGTTITQVRVTRAGSSTIGFHLDDIDFIGGGSTSVGGGLTLELADARYAPLVHAERHEDGGADELDVTGLSGILADPQKLHTADPGAPVNDTAWIKRTGAGPYEITLNVRIAGATTSIPLATIP